MHEIGIADSILEAVKMEASRRPGCAPTKVAVRIGELAGVDPDALRFCFQALTTGTELGSFQLEIEYCPPRYLCTSCSFEFSASGFDSCCPQCGTQSTRCIGGDQLELAYLELEEYEPSTT